MFNFCQRFMVWNSFQAIVMMVQNRYQRRRMYTRIALGKNSAMDVVGGESSGGKGQLLLLYPMLFGECCGRNGFKGCAGMRNECCGRNGVKGCAGMRNMRCYFSFFSQLLTHQLMGSTPVTLPSSSSSCGCLLPHTPHLPLIPPTCSSPVLAGRSGHCGGLRHLPLLLQP